MAIRNRDDELSKILGDDGLDYRLHFWLWHYLKFKGIQFSVGASYQGTRDFMASVIKENPQISADVLAVKDFALVPDSYLSWICDDLRQGSWVFGRLGWLFGLSLDLIHPALTGRQRVIALIDSRFIDLQQKIDHIQKAENDWILWVERDFVFDWFKKKCERERCGFAWDWLRRNYPDKTSGKAFFENYQGLLLFFDGFSQVEAEKLLVIEKIKKAWSQKQYRKNLEDKKQCNLLLPEKTLRLLDELSERHSLAKSEIVDLLIKDEFEKGIYISERLAKRRSLLL